MALKGPHTDLTLEREPIHAALTACKIGIAMRQLAASVERNLRNAIWMAPCHWEVHPSGRAGSTGVKPTPRPIAVGVELYTLTAKNFPVWPRNLSDGRRRRVQVQRRQPAAATSSSSLMTAVEPTAATASSSSSSLLTTATAVMRHHLAIGDWDRPDRRLEKTSRWMLRLLVTREAVESRPHVAIPRAISASAAQAGRQVQRRLLLDVVFGQHAASFQLVTEPVEPLFVERDALPG